MAFGMFMDSSTSASRRLSSACGGIGGVCGVKVPENIEVGLHKVRCEGVVSSATRREKTQMTSSQRRGPDTGEVVARRSTLWNFGWGDQGGG